MRIYKSSGWIIDSFRMITYIFSSYTILSEINLTGFYRIEKNKLTLYHTYSYDNDLKLLEPIYSNNNTNLYLKRVTLSNGKDLPYF